MIEYDDHACLLAQAHVLVSKRLKREKRTTTSHVEAGVPQEQTLNPLNEMNDLSCSTSKYPGPEQELTEEKANPTKSRPVS
jgi:hypothetical protein